MSNEVLWCRVKKCVRSFWSRCSKSWSFKFAHVQTQSSTYAQLALNGAETIVIITHSYSEFRQRKQTGTPQMCEHKTGEKPAARPSSDRTTELIGCLACTHPSMRAVGGGANSFCRTTSRVNRGINRWHIIMLFAYNSLQPPPAPPLLCADAFTSISVIFMFLICVIFLVRDTIDC